MTEAEGKITKAKDRPGTTWELPFTLFEKGLSGFKVVGRFKTETLARQAAKRRNIKVTKVEEEHELISRVLASGDARATVNEIAAHKQQTVTKATVEQWKKDLRRLTKIYRDIDLTQSGVSPSKETVSKFIEAKDLYSNFKHNFRNWVFIGLLGMPSLNVQSGDPYFEREKRHPHYSEVRKLAWTAVYELDTTLFPDQWDPRTGGYTPAPWSLNIKKRDAIIAKYNKAFSAAFKAILKLIDYEASGDRKGTSTKYPETTTMTIAGYHVTLQRVYSDSSNTDYDEVKEAVDTLNKALPLLQKRASAAYPPMAKIRLPILFDTSMDIDRAATYSKWKRSPVINLKVCGVNRKNVVETAKILAHELGHHIYRGLDGNAQSFWETAIKSNYGPLDVALLDKVWPSNKTLLSIAFDVADKHPLLHLQLMAIIGGYADCPKYRYSEIDSKDEFFGEVNKGNIPHVMRNPITAYAHKNPEEAFCEALSMYVIYGNRTVHPFVRRWLKTTLPGLRLSESAEIIDLVANGVSPIEVLQEITSVASIGTMMPKKMGMVRCTRKKDDDEELEESDAVAKPSHLKDRFKEVSLGKDNKGYYVYTHRCRSKSYPTPDAIPLDRVEFIASTG